MRAGEMRHVVNIMRPTKALDERGQLQGVDPIVVKEWPCSITPVSGSKPANERMVVPTATHTVEGYGDPTKPLKTTYWLTGGTLGERELTIQYIEDRNQNGINLRLVCEERPLV